MTATLPVCVRGIATSPRFIAVISVSLSNYHKPFLSSSRRWTHPHPRRGAARRIVGQLTDQAAKSCMTGWHTQRTHWYGARSTGCDRQDLLPGLKFPGFCLLSINEQQSFRKSVLDVVIDGWVALGHARLRGR